MTLEAESGRLQQVTSKYNPDSLGARKTKTHRLCRSGVLEGPRSGQQVRHAHVTNVQKKCHLCAVVSDMTDFN